MELLSQALPATYIAFDVLFLNGKERLEVPLGERKQLLQRILDESSYLVESRYIPEKGKTFFHEAVAAGLEGVMAKAVASPYLVGQRSRFWLKIKPRGRTISYIIGYSEGKGERQASFGSLAVASLEGGEWVFRGMVGSGFSAADLADISSRLQTLRLPEPPIPLACQVKGITWVQPELKCWVTFQEITPRGHFRVPAFKGLLE